MAGAQPAKCGCLQTNNTKGPPDIPAGAPAIGTLGPAGVRRVRNGGLLDCGGGLLVT